MKPHQTSPPFLEFGQALADFEQQLHEDKSIYDFKITRQDSENKRERILLFKIRCDDFTTHNKSPKLKDKIEGTINFICSQAQSISALAKQVGYTRCILEITSLANNKPIHTASL